MRAQLFDKQSPGSQFVMIQWVYVVICAYVITTANHANRLAQKMSGPKNQI